MRSDVIEATLTAEEWGLVSALRAIPESPLKLRVRALVDTALAFAEEPRCARMQGDGVPCDTVHAQCDQCVHVTSMIDALAQQRAWTAPETRSAERGTRN